MKIHTLGAELFHAIRLKDIYDETNSRFLRFITHLQIEL
jgi:hypothetical protein